MSLFRRIHEVVTANINDLIDKVEDPERMIKQVIREMEENIDQAKQGVIEAIASEKQLYKELKSHQEQAVQWKQKAETALKADKEDLAREALMRKKEHDKIATTLASSWASAKNTSDRLKSQLQALEKKLDEAKQKRASLVARQRAAEAHQQMDSTLKQFEKGRDAQRKFDRMEEKVADMEARSEAIDEINQQASQLEKEFWALEVDQDVEDELVALKKNL